MPKTKTAAIVLFLMLSLSASMILSTVSAHSPPWQVPTYMYVSVSPNPVGVGKQ